jgi:methionyl-tRNA synthetase
MNPADDDRPVLVLGPTPTPNGGMHLGHIAGPYLAGDVYARYQRLRGRSVVYTSGTDDSQTYVTASARRLGRTREELCRTSTGEIRHALSSMGISVDGFGPFDDAYRTTVVDFFRGLYDAGKFRARTVRLPYLERTGEFLVEGLVEGGCPVCLATSRGGLCETCGHPNYFDELTDPHSTVDPTDRPTVREATILVLPLEEYRDRLATYHDRYARHWRPRVTQLIREVMARPLPDLPITYPLDWGIPAPFAETPGQVFNAWLETVPSGMFTAAHAATLLGRPSPPGRLWKADERMRLVHFLGFDYVYIWCVPDIALLMAHGEDTILPEWVVANEFYELESAKFSTSKRHVLTCEDVLSEVPRDALRLYLALTAPEYQRTTFIRAGLDRVAEDRLFGPWNRLAATLGKAVANARDPRAALPVSAAARDRVATMLRRFDAAYEMPSYSLSRVADTILVHIDRLTRRAGELDGVGVDDEPRAWGEMFAEVGALLAAAAPVLVDLAAAARAAGCPEPTLAAAAYEIREIRPFAPPWLPADVTEPPPAYGRG